MNSNKVHSSSSSLEQLFEHQENLEINQAGLFKMDRDLKVILWDPNMETLTGIPREEIIGQDLFSEKYQHLFSRKKIFEEALKIETSFLFTQQSTATGLWFDVSIFPVDNGLTITVKNVTREKKQEEEIINIKNIKKYVLNSTSDIIWAIDTQYKLLVGNDAYLKMMKTSTGKEISINDPILQNDLTNDPQQQRRTMWQKSYDKALSGNAHSTRFSVSEGAEEKYYQVQVNPIYSDKQGEKGQIIGAACFSRDITERQNHVKSIENQNQRLRDIAWFQSHRVRAPLTNILGLSQLMEEASNASEANELVDLLVQSAKELDQIISDISNKARQ